MADTQVETVAPTGAPLTASIGARAAHRAATLIELSKVSDAPAVEASSATTDEAEAAGVDDATQTAAHDAAVEAVADEPAKVEAAADDKPDAETEKRIGAVQKAAKRAGEELTRARAEAKAEHDARALELDRREAAVKSFETLKARAKYAPAEVLAELGLTDDDFESAARDLYARSKAGGADPKNRDAAIRMQREREATDKITATERKLADLEAKLVAKDQQTQYEQAWQGFYADVSKAATADTSDAPLMRAAMAKNPGKVQRAAQDLSARLYQESGEWPDPADVIVAFEKQQRAHLEDLGVDIASVIKPTAKAALAAPAPTAARTLAADMAGATPVSGRAKTRQEQRDETRRLMESGKVSD